MGENICACYVGHHDEAYRWAERHKQEVHPVTGAMQIVEVVERTEEVVRRIVREELVVPPLFRNYEKDYLLALGIPEVWLDAVMAVSDDGGLLEMVSHLPQEAGERLLELADGKPVPRPESLKHVNPYEHPDAQRRFKTIDSKDALREALEFPVGAVGGLPASYSASSCGAYLPRSGEGLRRCRHRQDCCGASPGCMACTETSRGIGAAHDLLANIGIPAWSSGRYPSFRRERGKG